MVSIKNNFEIEIGAFLKNKNVFSSSKQFWLSRWNLFYKSYFNFVDNESEIGSENDKCHRIITLKSDPRQ